MRQDSSNQGAQPLAGLPGAPLYTPRSVLSSGLWKQLPAITTPLDWTLLGLGGEQWAWGQVPGPNPGPGGGVAVSLPGAVLLREGALDIEVAAVELQDSKATLVQSQDSSMVETLFPKPGGQQQGSQPRARSSRARLSPQGPGSGWEKPLCHDSMEQNGTVSISGLLCHPNATFISACSPEYSTHMSKSRMTHVHEE